MIRPFPRPLCEDRIQRFTSPTLFLSLDNSSITRHQNVKEWSRRSSTAIFFPKWIPERFLKKHTHYQWQGEWFISHKALQRQDHTWQLFHVLGSSHFSLCQFSNADSDNEGSISLGEKTYQDAELFFPIACDEKPRSYTSWGQEQLDRYGNLAARQGFVPVSFYSPLV